MRASVTTVPNHFELPTHALRLDLDFQYIFKAIDSSLDHEARADPQEILVAMDPLSITASVIAIVGLTTKLTGFLSEVKSASDQQRHLAIEASNLSFLLTSLRFRVDKAARADPWFHNVQMLASPDGPLDQLRATLENITSRLDLSSSHIGDRLRSALLWPFSKSEIKDALVRIERLKSLISCALTDDLL